MLISVLIVNKSIQEVGIIANAAFVIGLSVGREIAEATFGHDVIDGDGTTHSALTCISHHVRKAGASKLRSVRTSLLNHPDIRIVDYTEDARTPDYAEYAHNLSKHSGDDIVYRAIHVIGPEHVVGPLTSNLSRL